MEAIIFMGFDEFINTPLYKFGLELLEKFVAIKVVTQSPVDCNKLIVHNLKGDWFTVFPKKSSIKQGSKMHFEVQQLFGENVDLDRLYEIRFWDYKGGIFLGCMTFQIESLQEPIPPGVVQKIKDMMDLYSDRKVMCSDCFKHIDILKAGGTVWAGIYCIDCWEGRTGRYAGKGGWQGQKEKIKLH